MEIIRDVYQIKLPLPLTVLEYVNVYIVKGIEGAILIDTGWNTPEAFSALGDGLKEHGIGWKDITQIVITHIHVDHYGLAGKIRKLCGAKVAMHRIEAELIDPQYVNFQEVMREFERGVYSAGSPSAKLLGIEEAYLWMADFVTPSLPDVELNAGDTISNGSFEFEVIWTPGHSPGHICLYEPKKRLLFSGDQVLHQITPNVGLYPQYGDNPLGDYINSLKTIEGLEVNLVLPGHGPVFDSLKPRIAEILDHHEERKKTTTKAIKGESRTAYQITRQIRWIPQQGGVAFQDLSALDRLMAIMETVAHLRLLITEGRVREIERDGISFYLAK